MHIAFARPPVKICLSAQHRYSVEGFIGKVRKLHRQGQQIWLVLDSGANIMLQPEEFPLSCKVVLAEHDNIVGQDIPMDDGWEEETLEMEANAEAHMLAPESDAECDNE